MRRETSQGFRFSVDTLDETNSRLRAAETCEENHSKVETTDRMQVSAGARHAAVLPSPR